MNVHAHISNVSPLVGKIRCEMWEAIDAFEKLGPLQPNGFKAEDVEYLDARLNGYIYKLSKLENKAPAGLKKQAIYAKHNLLDTYDARFCAVVRSLARSDKYPSLAGIKHLTEKLSVWEPLAEPIVVHWQSKEPKSGYRLIMNDGIMRTAQRLMIRDMLSVMNIDSDIDFTRKGAGGERALVKAICKDIEQGYNWWWMPDIKDCFPSIRPGHFKWLPLDHRLVKNSFTPKCAEIKVAKHDDYLEILQWMKEAYSDLPVGYSYSDFELLTVQIAQRGLSQGSVLAPLLTRSVIKRLLDGALPDPQIARYAFMDDLNIGACTKGQALAAKEIVTTQLLSHPAGPIELHDEPVINVQTGMVVALGYKLEPGNGHGDNYVHVKPWGKRIKRFKSKLWKKLSEAEPGADLFEIAETYRRRWFNSQQAWTKVPELSDDTSANITATYVDDFIHGILLGTMKLNKPKIKYAGGDPPWT
jgi:hypothetical protein